MTCLVSKSHRWRDTRLSRSKQFRHDRADRWPATDRSAVSPVPSAETLEGVVATSAADDRSNEDELFSSGGNFRKALADLNSGDGRRDRVELATDLLRCVCLDFPHVLVRRSATQEDVDHSLVTTAVRAGSFGSEKVRKTKTGDASHRKSADFQKAAARNTVTIGLLARAEDGQHGRSPEVGTDAEHYIDR